MDYLFRLAGLLSCPYRHLQGCRVELLARMSLFFLVTSGSKCHPQTSSSLIDHAGSDSLLVRCNSDVCVRDKRRGEEEREIALLVQTGGKWEHGRFYDVCCALAFLSVLALSLA